MAQTKQQDAACSFKFGASASANPGFSFEISPKSSPSIANDNKDHHWDYPGHFVPHTPSPTGFEAAQTQYLHPNYGVSKRYTPSPTFNFARSPKSMPMYTQNTDTLPHLLAPPRTPPPPGLTKSPENLEVLLKLSDADNPGTPRDSRPDNTSQYASRDYGKKATKFVPQEERAGGLKLPGASPKQYSLDPTIAARRLAYSQDQDIVEMINNIEKKQADGMQKPTRKPLTLNADFPQTAKYTASSADTSASLIGVPAGILRHGMRKPVDDSANSVSPSPARKDKTVTFDLPSANSSIQSLPQMEKKVKKNTMPLRTRDFEPIGDQLRELGYVPPSYMGIVGPAGWQPFPNHEDAARHAAETSPIKPSYRHPYALSQANDLTTYSNESIRKSLSSQYPPKEERIPPSVRFNGHATDLEAERSQPVNLDSQMDEMEVLLQQSLRLKGIQGENCERLCRLAAEAYAEIFPYELSGTTLDL